MISQNKCNVFLCNKILNIPICFKLWLKFGTEVFKFEIQFSPKNSQSLRKVLNRILKNRN